MKAELKARKPKAGLLLIASPRFKNLYGPQRGTYGERKEKAVTAGRTDRKLSRPQSLITSLLPRSTEFKLLLSLRFL